MNLQIQQLQQTTENDVADLKDTFAYEVDDFDMICHSASVSKTGQRFTDKKKLSTNINFDSIFSDTETRSLFRRLLEHVRDSRGVVSFPYRCDTESICKYYRLTVSISSSRHILFFNKLLASDARQDGVRWKPVYCENTDAIELCSICNKLLVNDQWEEYQELVDSNLWPNSGLEMPCRNTVCKQCK